MIKCKWGEEGLAKGERKHKNTPPRLLGHNNRTPGCGRPRAKTAASVVRDGLTCYFSLSHLCSTDGNRIRCDVVVEQEVLDVCRVVTNWCLWCALAWMVSFALMFSSSSVYSSLSSVTNSMKGAIYICCVHHHEHSIHGGS